MLTYHSFSSPLGDITLYLEDAFLIGLDLTSYERFHGRLTQRLGKYLPIEEAVAAKTRESALIEEWLEQYWQGKDSPFPVELRFYGTEFQKRVWTALRQIPRGSTVSYQELSQMVGCKGCRAVGTAVGLNPIPIVVPCHRVIRKSGALGNFSACDGAPTKAKLLRLEGVSQFDAAAL